MAQESNSLQKAKTIVIMAAGMGSRYGGLKQIDAMGPSGEILMEYSIFDALSAGFNKVVFIIKKSMEKDFREQIEKKLSPYIEIDYAYQALEDIPAGFTVPEGRNKPWGTSQAILSARNIITTPFAVFNADDFYGHQAFECMSQHLNDISGNYFESSMVGFEIGKTLSPHGTVTRGLCKSNQGFLSTVTEISKIGLNKQGTIEFTQEDKTSALTGKELCSMNFWGFTPHLFEFLKKDFPRFLKNHGSEMKSEWLIPTTVDSMIQQKVTKVKILESTDQWFGVTYPEDKSQVVTRIKELVDKGIYPSPLFPQKNNAGNISG